MSNLVTVGLQWGDEGKGKIVDYLSPSFDIVARFQGGSNAGHTVVVGDRTYKFRIMPSGVIQGKTAVIGNGVVVDLSVLVDELKQLESTGTTVDMVLSERAHVITPFHVQIDGLMEEAKGKGRVGTTRRGIGPTYSDKALRNGVRVCDLIDGDSGIWETFYSQQATRIERIYGACPVEGSREMWERLRSLTSTLGKYVMDSGEYLVNAMNEGKSILFEGAQGTLLDIDHGTYPYVTSSNCIAAAAATGTGVPLSALHEVLGVCKAYTTRVGAGPFPTELHNETGRILVERGGERGVVTGRPRRCGWLDLVAVRYAVRLNGAKALAVTKVDVLADINPVEVCVAYSVDGTEVSSFPASVSRLARVQPTTEELPGWSTEEIRRWSSGSREFDDLPGHLREYLDLLSRYTGAEIAVVSTGPSRSDTITVEGVLDSLTDA